MHPKISIIIPCYNLENYIPKCLNSIENQNNQNIEYIFVNDGSTDLTSNLIMSFCKKYDYCYLINKINGGVSSARNVALSIAKGEYIYLLDGDDFLADGAIEKMLNAVKDSIPDIVLSPFYERKNELSISKELNINKGDYDIDSFYKIINSFPTTTKLIYRRSIITAGNIIFNPILKYGEVYEFSIKLLNQSSLIRVIDDKLFHYVIHEESATTSHVIDKKNSIINTLEEYVKNDGRFGKYSSYWITAFHMFMTFCYKKYLIIDNSNLDAEICMKKTLQSKSCKIIIKKVAFGCKIPLRQRLKAIYIYYTKTYGFKFARILFRTLNR